MPFAQIHLVEGHSAEQRRAVIVKVTDALQNAVGAPRPNIRVWLKTLPKCDFGIGGETVDTLDDTALPFAQIVLIEGRSEEQKRAVIESVTQALEDAVGAARQAIRVWIQEVPKTNWGIAGQTAKDLGR